MPIQLLDDSIIGEREKILLYGGFGTGKTFASGTMPGNIWSMVFGGMNELKTLRSPDFKRKYPKKDGHIIFSYVKENIGKRGMFLEANAYDWACDAMDEMLEAEEKGDLPFEKVDSIVIDAATGLRNFAMNKALEVSYHLAGNPDKASLTKLREHGIRIVGDTDYGKEQSLVAKFIEWVYHLDKHVLVITHEWRDEKTDRATREKKLRSVEPLFTGKHRVDIPQLFDNVWRMTTGGGGRSQVFECQTVGDEIIAAKTRMGGVLPLTFRDLNFEDCIKRFKTA